MTKTMYDIVADHMECLLIVNNIKYTRERLYEGWQFYIEGTNGDIVCHGSSYGGKNGLWESMGFDWDEEDVTGYLTAQEVINRLKEYYGM